MFVPFARPFFACHSNIARPRTFLSVFKFSEDSIFVHQSPYPRSTMTWCWQTIFRLKLNFSTVWPAPILWSDFIANSYFGWNLLAFGKISFLSLTLLCFSVDIQKFYYHKTHKKNSNYVAVLVFTCCTAPMSLRVVDSLRHTHAFSRVTLREFLVKWATMAVPMVSENVRFKINFMMYNILTN